MSVSYGGTSDYQTRSGAVVSAVPLSMACWANSNSITASQGILTIASQATATDYFAIYMTAAGKAAARVVGTNVGGESDSAGTVTAGTWHHFGGVFSSNTNRVAYLDGVAATANTSSFTPSFHTPITGTAGLFAGSSTVANPYNGFLLWGTIWNIALATADMASLATGIEPFLVHPEAIVAYFPLNFNGALGIDLWSSTGLTSFGAPAFSTTNPAVFPWADAQVVPFFATQNATVTISPVVTLSLTGTVSGGAVAGGREVFSDGLGGHLYP